MPEGPSKQDIHHQMFSRITMAVFTKRGGWNKGEMRRTGATNFLVFGML